MISVISQKSADTTRQTAAQTCQPPAVISTMGEVYALYDRAIRKPKSESVYMCPHVVGFTFFKLFLSFAHL